MLGFSQEHGPYVNDDGTTDFIKNEWSWNKEANMLYLEMPGGVGYSYCETEELCNFDDTTTSEDNLMALIEWFKLYPDYASHNTYVAGESYAGVYVPYMVL
jgi:serine carboxypeptidase-like clade 2